MSQHPTQLAESERWARGLMEKLRRAEVEAVRPWFSPGTRVLDLGGGSGFQASILASWGCEVVSVDIPERPVPQTLYYPVQDYDGTNLPFADESFDIVFSSNVLEHIEPLPPLLAETRRVLRPAGRAVHIMPSPVWRLWTSLTHPVYLLKLLRERRRSGVAAAPAVDGLEPDGAHPGRSLFSRAKAILLPGPHGVYPSALAELYYFGKPRWSAVLEKNGFKVERVAGNGLFYTGNVLLPDMPFKIRLVMARVLGNACYVFIARRTL